LVKGLLLLLLLLLLLFCYFISLLFFFIFFRVIVIIVSLGILLPSSIAVIGGIYLYNKRHTQETNNSTTENVELGGVTPNDGGGHDNDDNDQQNGNDANEGDSAYEPVVVYAQPWDGRPPVVAPEYGQVADRRVAPLPPTPPAIPPRLYRDRSNDEIQSLFDMDIALDNVRQQIDAALREVDDVYSNIGDDESEYSIMPLDSESPPPYQATVSPSRRESPPSYQATPPPLPRESPPSYQATPPPLPTRISVHGGGETPPADISLDTSDIASFNDLPIFTNRTQGNYSRYHRRGLSASTPQSAHRVRLPRNMPQPNQSDDKISFATMSDNTSDQQATPAQPDFEDPDLTVLYDHDIGVTSPTMSDQQRRRHNLQQVTPAQPQFQDPDLTGGDDHDPAANVQPNTDYYHIYYDALDRSRVFRLSPSSSDNDSYDDDEYF
jgi:hypothetical protein